MCGCVWVYLYSYLTEDHRPNTHQPTEDILATEVQKLGPRKKNVLHCIADVKISHSSLFIARSSNLYKVTKNECLVDTLIQFCVIALVIVSFRGPSSEYTPATEDILATGVSLCGFCDIQA